MRMFWVAFALAVFPVVALAVDPAPIDLTNAKISAKAGTSGTLRIENVNVCGTYKGTYSLDLKWNPLTYVFEANTNDAQKLTPGPSTARPTICDVPNQSGVLNSAFQLNLGTYVAVSSTVMSYAITGTLPNGLSLNPNTGVVSGSPVSVGTSSVTWTVTDANGTSTPGTIQIDIAGTAPTPTPTGPTIGNAPNQVGSVGTLFNLNLSAYVSNTSGTAVTYSIAAGTLPNGLSLDITTGVISGTPSVGGTFNITWTARDSRGLGTPADAIQFVISERITAASCNVSAGEVFGASDRIWSPFSEVQLWPIPPTTGSGSLGRSVSFVADANTYPNGVRLSFVDEVYPTVPKDYVVSECPHSFNPVSANSACTAIGVGTSGGLYLRFGLATRSYDCPLNAGQTYYINFRDYNTPRGNVSSQFVIYKRTD